MFNVKREAFRMRTNNSYVQILQMPSTELDISAVFTHDWTITVRRRGLANGQLKVYRSIITINKLFQPFHKVSIITEASDWRCYTAPLRKNCNFSIEHHTTVKSAH